MNRLQRYLHNENIVALFVSLTSFIVYLTTLSPTVSFTDSGELAAVATTLGIAHPTGYPLFTLVGRLAVMFPFPAEEIVKLNLLAALLTAAATGFFVKSSFALLKAKELFGIKSGGKSYMAGDLSFSIILGGLALAFSSTFWSQSSETEVYSLHLFLILCVTTFFVRGLSASNHDELPPFLFLFAFTLGLSFGNHMTTILLAPAFLYLFFGNFGFQQRSFRVLFLLSPFFLLGLSIYLYLPIRSATNPLFDWGQPATLERFFWHVSGKQYRIWMFSGWESAKEQLTGFLTTMPLEFNWGLLALTFVGILTLLRQAFRLLMFMFLAFAASVAYSINYTIHDIATYFLLAYIVCAWLVVVGISWVISFMRRQVHTLVQIVVVALLLGTVGFQFWQNRNHVDRSNNFLVEDFVRNAFEGLPLNAVVFTGMWDYFVSPAYYYQTVRKERKDIVIIDKNLLKDRSWYFLQLETWYPWLIEQSREKAEAFLVELHKFERGIPFNAQVIQNRWDDLLSAMVEKSIAGRPVYVDGRIEPEFPTGYRRIPEGLFFRLSKSPESVPREPFRLVFRGHSLSVPAAKDMRQYYVFMLIQNVLWLKNNGKLEEADMRLQNALAIEPSNKVLHRLRQELGTARSQK